MAAVVYKKKQYNVDTIKISVIMYLVNKPLLLKQLPQGAKSYKCHN